MKIELYAKIDKIVRNLNLAILTIFLIIVNLNIWNVANNMNSYIFDDVIKQVFVWIAITIILMIVMDVVRFLLFNNSAHTENNSDFKNNLKYYFNNIFINSYKNKTSATLKSINILLVLCFVLVSVYAFSNSKIYALEKQHEIDIINAQVEALKYHREAYDCVPKID